jgi:hypothetical protein
MFKFTISARCTILIQYDDYEKCALIPLVGYTLFFKKKLLSNPFYCFATLIIHLFLSFCSIVQIKLNLYCEGQIGATDTTLPSLAKPTIVLFSGVVRACRKGHFRYVKRIDYELADAQDVEIAHSIKYVTYNF